MSEVIHASQGYVTKTARQIAAEEVAKVVANAPADLDTLKEIAAYIESDKTGAAQMVTQIDANAKAISDEEKRAKEAESALSGRVKELEENSLSKVVETKWADLRVLHDNSQLMPGM
jgi:DNA-binding transcriptional regulator GbsR (MarR family)